MRTWVPSRSSSASACPRAYRRKTRVPRAAALYAFGVLHGRDRERERIGALVDEAWAFRGGGLVLRGQPGVGKSTLLREAVSRGEGMQVLTTQGIESESPLAFAALQRLLRPVMRYAEHLPAPQVRALRAAFGEDAEPGGDRFLVFLAP